MKSNVIKYYYSDDGAHRNIKVRLIHGIAGLWVAHVVESELIGPVGSDGQVYVLVPERMLFDVPQPW